MRVKPDKVKYHFDPAIVNGPRKLDGQLVFKKYEDFDNDNIYYSVIAITYSHLLHKVYKGKDMRTAFLEASQKGVLQILLPRTSSTGMGSSQSNIMISLNDIIVRGIYPKVVEHLYQANKKLI